MLKLMYGLVIFYFINQILKMQNTRMVECNPDFIRQALYDRYDDVKDRWWMEIHSVKIDDLVDMIAEMWTAAGSASEIIDNRLINWEQWTFEDIRRYYLREDWERFGDSDQIEKVVEYLDSSCFMYDRWLQEFCSY